MDDWGRKRVWFGALDNLPSERRCAAAAGWINSKLDGFFKNHISYLSWKFVVVWTNNFFFFKIKDQMRKLESNTSRRGDQLGNGNFDAFVACLKYKPTVLFAC